MLGKDVKYLAGVADLTQLDLEAASLTIVSDGEAVLANYTGGYAVGWRKLEAALPRFNIAVSAGEFKSLTALLNDDEEIKLTVGQSYLTLTSADSGVRFRQKGDPSPPETVDRTTLELAVQVSLPDLLAECEVAATFVAETPLRPVLTGIRFEVQPGGLDVIAFNGFGALFNSHVEAISVKGKPAVRGFGSLTVPTADFLKGLRLISGDGPVVFAKDATGHVYLYNDDAMFRSSLISGEWPDTSRIRLDQPDIEIDIPARQIAGLVGSVRILKAGPEVDAVTRDGRIVFGVSGESGSFAIRVKGKLPKAIHYDATTLGLASRLGELLHFGIPQNNARPTVVTVGKRRCWLVTRV